MVLIVVELAVAILYQYKPSRRSAPWRLVCDVTAAAAKYVSAAVYSFCHAAAAAVMSQKCDVHTNSDSVTDELSCFVR